MSKQKKIGKGKNKGMNVMAEEKSVGTQVVSAVPRGMIRPTRDLKFVDVSLSAVAYDNTGSIVLLNGIAEGDDFTSRNSRSVMIHSVALRGFAYSSNSAGAAGKIRTMVVWDNAANGAALTFAQLLATTDANSFPNVNFEKRFTILWDSGTVLGNTNTAATLSVADKSIVSIEVLIKVNAPVAFNGTGATIASIQNGSIYLCTVGDNAAGVTRGAGIISSRVRFMENDSL